MKYNEGGFLQKLKDEQYKSKVMLAVFGVIVVFMILFARLNVQDYNKSKAENNSNNEVGYNTSYENEMTNWNYESDSFNYKFSYLILSNYEFSYNITLGDKIITSSGKRSTNKMLFDFKYDGEESLLFVDKDGSITSDDGQEISRFPYFFVNYYDIQDVAQLISNFTYNGEDNKYHITSFNLYRLGDTSFTDFSLENPESDNTVELKEVDGKVVGIVMDFTNMFSSEKTGNYPVVFDLNYSNFGFVEDFDKPF